ncbi:MULTISPECIES: GGDEF domain-containing protein [Giesbergeria]|uniref:diguanylate cyclase n=1 Tax=Giesbergeria sinuosa TaxID=80883 RepID=A0ABV9QHF2_9BURK
MAQRPPSDIARETLKQLAVRRLPPTPENYQALYDEIAGHRSPAPFPEGPLRHILRIIPGQTPAQKRLLDQFEAAVALHDWSALQNVLVGYAKLGLHPQEISVAEPPAPAGPTTLAVVLPNELAEQIARMVEYTLPALDSEDVRVHMLGEQLVQFLRQPQPPVSTAQLMLANFSYRLSFATEDQAAIRSTLLELLHMVFENIAALSADDQWLSGQAEALMAATAQTLSLRRLDDVRLRLKDVIFKQTEAKGRMVEAQEQMKELLAIFIDRLAALSRSSGNYQEQIERCADLLGKATTLHQITPVLKEVMAATRAMALDSRVAHGELSDLRQRTEEKQAEMARLQQELDRVSAQARHDPLTGSLNRKGLDEVMERELARARRQGTPLCLALLDVDNFKQINDRLGHDIGDAALVHLADVVREIMRPQDMLGRYGGEEFVLVLPDTSLPQGVEAMQRLQRELSTRFFMQGPEKVLITFSAGVAEIELDETSTEALRRADQGMYLAKRSGKNRVMAA